MNNPKKQMIAAAKQRCKKSGLECTIKPSDFSIPERCPYLGVPLVYVVGEGARQDAPSLDRIDNRLGYVKGNVEVISRLANTMKSSATVEQLIKFADSVLARNVR